MKRLVLTLMVAAATMLGVSALAPSTVSAQYGTVQPPGISTNVPSVTPGGSFTVTVTNCLPGETVIITFQGVSQTVTCNSTILQASATFNAPTTPGTYEVCANFTGGGAAVPPGVTRPATVCTTIQVSAAGPPVPTTIPGGGTPPTGSTVPPTTGSTVPATTTGGGLPATGSSGLGTTTTTAIVLLGAGALLLVVSQVRRRRTTAAA